MLRRSIARKGFQMTNPDVDPSYQFSPFGWHYSASQVMPLPRRHNRTHSMPYRGIHVKRYKGVSIRVTDEQLHPVFRVALEPFLSKLMWNRVIPSTNAADAVNEYVAVSPRVGDVNSKHAWLAKCAELCAVKESATERIVDLWLAEDCQSRYVTGTRKPSEPLVKGILCCAAVGLHPGWKTLFSYCAAKTKWNLTPSFCTVQWSQLLTCAGKLSDEVGVVALLDEMIDVQADTERLSDPALVWALNAIVSAPQYAAAKNFLQKLTVDKVKRIAKKYRGMRRQAEMTADGAVVASDREKTMWAMFRENDAMLYHVQWFERMKSPLAFNPRQLYFNFSPPKEVDKRDAIKMTAEQVVKAKVDKWKDEGYLPADYVHDDVIDDQEQRSKNVLRQERWKKKPKILEDKRFGYTPE